MRPENSIWQGNFGYWQHGFIQTNLLVIGYTGWKGFQSFGRGIVVCDVDDRVLHSTITNLEPIPFTIQFIPASLMEFYFGSLSLDSLTISSILEVVATYNPEQNLLLGLKINHRIEVNFFNKMAIAPAECYEQVCRRWDEFQVNLLP